MPARKTEQFDHRRDHLRAARELPTSAVHNQPDLQCRQVEIRRHRLEGTQRTGPVETFRYLPGLTLGLQRVLHLAQREIERHAHAEDRGQRLFRPCVAERAADQHRDLGFVVDAATIHRHTQRGPQIHDAGRRLDEKQGFVRHGIAEFRRVRRVVAPDAHDLAHGKMAGRGAGEGVAVTARAYPRQLRLAFGRETTQQALACTAAQQPLQTAGRTLTRTRHTAAHREQQLLQQRGVVGVSPGFGRLQKVFYHRGMGVEVLMITERILQATHAKHQILRGLRGLHACVQLEQVTAALRALAQPVPGLGRRVGGERFAFAAELAQRAACGGGKNGVTGPFALVHREARERFEPRDQRVPPAAAESAQHGAALTAAQAPDIAQQQAQQRVCGIRSSAQIIGQSFDQHVHVAQAAAVAREPAALVHEFGGIRHGGVALEHAQRGAQSAQFHAHLVQGFDVGVALDAWHEGGEPASRDPEERKQRLSLGGYGGVQHRVVSLGKGVGC